MTHPPDDDTDTDDVVEVGDHLIINIDGQTAGQRLDAIVPAVTALSRAAVQRLIEEGQVELDGIPVAKAAIKPKAGQVIGVRIPPAAPTELVAEALPLTVLFEDAHLIVIDKAAGMVVHPAPGHASGTLVNALLYHCRDLSGIGGQLRPGIVHRLDKDTSGVMVASKHDAAHIALAELFATKNLLREYVALCAPAPRLASGRIATLYGRHPVDRKRFTSKVSAGKTAVTNYEVEQRYPCGAAQVRCRLETGRTHQIRVHMAETGAPLLGDRVYGSAPKPAGLRAVGQALGRQALHAARLAFDHPITGQALSFATEPPPDYQLARTTIETLAP